MWGEMEAKAQLGSELQARSTLGKREHTRGSAVRRMGAHRRIGGGKRDALELH